MITLVPYNSNWPLLFESEKPKILAAVGETIADIEHIGSTAIPGISAKPVIDILVGVKTLEDFNHQHIKAIESLGYDYVKTYEIDLPFRRFFSKNDKNQTRTHHIHLVNYNSAWWQRHILFRDYLRQNNSAAKEYEALKIQLAKTINLPADEKEREQKFYQCHILPFPELVQEYQKLRKTLAEHFTPGNQYALAKSRLIQSIHTKAYFDFEIHHPKVDTSRLHGYIPQTACFEKYKAMFQDADFIKCFGVQLTDESIHEILTRDTTHWDQYRYGPYVWFDQKNKAFVGEGGLNHTHVDGREEIELTYSLSKHYWGQGLAEEIGRFAIHSAFNTLDLDTIVCFTMPTNQQSLRVIEKLGFQYEKDFLYKSLPHQLFRLSNHENL